MHFVNAADEIYTPTSWLTFDDVLLKPQKSRFKSRLDPNILLDNFIGEIPIISANMDTVTGVDMAKEMHALGGLGILHRFYNTLDEYASVIAEVCATTYKPAFSVGCGDKWVDFTKNMLNNMQSATTPIVCLDVAHGHMEQSLETIAALRKLSDLYIIAGNVATGEAALDLAKLGANAVKVGVGSGSVCTTRIVTGHGIPQLSAIMNVRRAFDDADVDCRIIADGGIRNSGDIVKALAAGAEAVMLGNLLAGCDETPGEIFTTKDGSFKMYRGQSSRHFLKDIGKVGVAAEGESIEMRAKGPTKNIIDELVGGIRSGLTYSGCGTISELQNKAVFVEISHHGYVESTPHALSRLY
jgi:IMP dehydrogenase